MLIVIVGGRRDVRAEAVDEVNGFVQALPEYVHDLTHGRGRLGFLETEVPHRREGPGAGEDGGATKLLGLSGAAVSLTKSVITIVAATVTIVFLTFFMLLEGRDWVERCYSLLPERSQAALAQGRPRHLPDGRRLRDREHPDQPDRRRVDHDRAADHGRAVCGGARAARRDPRPDSARRRDGRRDRRRRASRSCTRSRPGSSLSIFFIVYQQLENHFLQPVIYGRTVQLSPLAVLVSVLVGAELAGVLGALAAIPVAGAIQVIIRDQLAARRGGSTPVADRAVRG